MATPRELRRRIRSVKNIAKVTGALEAVSASKVRRAQAQTLASRAYTAAALDILRELGRRLAGEYVHPYFQSRDEVRQVLVVLMSSDRGLAGPYNANIVREALLFEQQRSVPVRYVTVGRKGRDMMLRRGATVAADFTNLPATPSILDVTAIMRAAADEFVEGRADEVFLVYTRFVNTLRQEPVIERLLPMQAEQDADQQQVADGQRGPEAVFLFEPSAQVILDEFLPRFTEEIVYQALLEALASEHSARMVAMRNATENANALVEELTLIYNKARQLAITSEMLDIVGGAEALAQGKS